MGRILTLALVALVSGCWSDTAERNDVVIEIGGEAFRYSEFSRYVEEETGDDGNGLGGEVLSALLDQFVVEEQLRRLAIDRRLVDETSSRRGAVAALLAEASTQGASEAEILAYYEAHLEDFTEPERVRLRQVLVEERATAEEVVELLASGEAFEEVARRISIDPSAPFGGDQGELAQDDLPPAFAEAIFNLEPGSTSEILEAAYGYHIFQVVERLPAQSAPLSEVRDRIEAILSRRAADDRRTRLEEEARERYNVRLERHRLPFSYRGKADGVPSDSS